MTTVGALRALLSSVPDDTVIVVDVNDRLVPLALVDDTRWWPEHRAWSDEPAEDGDGTERVIRLVPDA